MRRVPNPVVEENRAALVPFVGDVQGAIPMYIEPLISLAPMQVPHPEVDEVLQHMYARMQEIAEETMDAEIEVLRDEEQALMILPSFEELPPEEQVVLPQDKIRQVR
jgi:hypothetical protein